MMIAVRFMGPAQSIPDGAAHHYHFGSPKVTFVARFAAALHYPAAYSRLSVTFREHLGGAGLNDDTQAQKVSEPEAISAVERRSLDPNRHGQASADFEGFLRSRIIGQDAAIEAIVDMYQMFLVGLNPPDRPIGNLLFLGPTGSGKTYVIEMVAEALFKNRHAFIKIDCAEFQQAHEIAKLIGSPPGYVGHKDTPPMLSQEAVDHWQTEEHKLSLVLFDEIEKASEALWQLLLGILDKGELTLGDNKQVNLSRCFVFMTSNLGATEMSSLVEGGIGFVPEATPVDEHLDAKIARTAMEAARRKFSPEFMNRIDKVVVFRSLRPGDLEKILDLELEFVQKRISTAAGQAHFTFRCSPEVKAWLLREGCDARYGARHLKRVIERHVVFALANLVATGQVVAGDRVEISLQGDGGFAFSKLITVASKAGSAS
jgi:ATP-dependent Clp protease ATP-binding subunit ClpB